MTCGVVTSLAAPTDVRCIHGNVTYTSGELFKPDACTTCRCSRDGGGRPSCVVEDCSATAATLSRINCRHVVTTTTECCARCDEPGCRHNGQFYAAGEVSLSSFLAYRRLHSTVALMLQCRVRRRRLSSVRDCVVAKRCLLEQKLLLTAYRKSHMRNRLVTKWVTLTFV